MLVAPSPNRHSTTSFSWRYLIAAAPPAASGRGPQLGVEHVHRPAAAVRRAGLLSEQLGHDSLGVDAARDGVPMLPIAGEDVVGQLEGQDRSHDRRLLADVEVAVPADLGLGVLLLGALLETPDQLHRSVDPEQEVAVLLLELELLRRDRRGGWGCGGFDWCDHLPLTIVQRKGCCSGGRVRNRRCRSGLNPSVGDVYRPALGRKRSLHDRFGQRRMRVHREVELIERKPVLDRQRRFGDEVGGAGSHDVDAEYAPGRRVRHNFHEAFGLPKRQRAAGGCEREAADLHLDAPLRRLLLTQPDVRDLRVRVHAVRRRVVVGDARVAGDVLDGAYTFI